MVVMEKRVDPKKLKRSFNLLGFDCLQFSECRGYSGGIAMA